MLSDFRTSYKTTITKLDMAAHVCACNSSIWEAEAEASLVWGQLELHRETLSQKQTTQKLQHSKTDIGIRIDIQIDRIDWFSVIPEMHLTFIVNWFSRDAEIAQWGMNSLFNKWCWANRISIFKWTKLYSYLTTLRLTQNVTKTYV
jgi:hypothetical protein